MAIRAATASAARVAPFATRSTATGTTPRRSGWRSRDRTPAKAVVHQPQRAPHLDGTYTVFGKVVSGAAALIRITQGMRSGQSPRSSGGRMISRRHVAAQLALLDAPGPDAVGFSAASPGHCPATVSPSRPAGPGLRLRPEQDPVPEARLAGDEEAARRPVLLLGRGDLAPASAGLRGSELRHAERARRPTRCRPASRSSCTPRTPIRADRHPAVHAARRAARCHGLPQAPGGAAVPRQLAEFAHTMRHEMVHIFQLDMLVETYNLSPARGGSSSRSGGARGWRSSGRPDRTRGTR